MVLAQKWPFFSMVVFGQIQPENIVFYVLDRKECFLNKKCQVLKKSKKSNFSKRVSPWFFAKMPLFFNGGIWANPARKDRLLKFWIEKNGFQTRKVKFYVFRQKQPFFSLVVFGQIQPEKIVFFLYSGLKNAIQTRKVKFYKSLRKSKFSKGVSP